MKAVPLQLISEQVQCKQYIHFTAFKHKTQIMATAVTGEIRALQMERLDLPYVLPLYR